MRAWSGIVDQEDGRARTVVRPLLLEDATGQHGGGFGLGRIAPQAGVGDDAADVLVAGEEEDAGGLVAHHRAFAAHAVEQGVRVLAEGGIERRELEHARRRLRHGGGPPGRASYPPRARPAKKVHRLKR